MEGIEPSDEGSKGMPAIKMSEDLSNTKKRGAQAPLQKTNYLRISDQKLQKYFFFRHE